MALMKLMGPKHISSVRVKMMTTLRTGLRYKDDFPELCCRCVSSLNECIEEDVQIDSEEHQKLYLRERVLTTRIRCSLVSLP